MNDIEDKFKDLDVQGIKRQYADTTSGIAPIYNNPSTNADLMMNNFAELVGQKKQYGVYTITPKDGFGKLVFSIPIDYNFCMDYHFKPMTATVNIPGATEKFFTTYKFSHVKVTVEMTSMLQQQGAVLFTQFNYPKALKDAFTLNSNMFDNCKFPRAFQCFGSCPTMEFNINWNTNLSYLPLPNYSDKQGNPSYDHGSLDCNVFSPLQVAEGVTDYVQLRVWTQLCGLRLGVYNPQFFEKGI
jgi:hypothetical protein